MPLIRTRCIYFKKGKCRACEKFCPTDAIKFDDVEKDDITLNVGSVILTAGFTPFNPDKFDNYQHAKFPNVVTSMEFERILSAGGPFGGHGSIVSRMEKSPRKSHGSSAWDHGI